MDFPKASTAKDSPSDERTNSFSSSLRFSEPVSFSQILGNAPAEEPATENTTAANLAAVNFASRQQKL